MVLGNFMFYLRNYGRLYPGFMFQLLAMMLFFEPGTHNRCQEAKQLKLLQLTSPAPHSCDE